VHGEEGLGTALKKLDGILGRNRVRQELRLTERHEKKGVKRRRLLSERWRKQFANEVCSSGLRKVREYSLPWSGTEEGRARAQDQAPWSLASPCACFSHCHFPRYLLLMRSLQDDVGRSRSRIPWLPQPAMKFHLPPRPSGLPQACRFSCDLLKCSVNEWLIYNSYLARSTFISRYPAYQSGSWPHVGARYSSN